MTCTSAGMTVGNNSMLQATNVSRLIGVAATSIPVRLIADAVPRYQVSFIFFIFCIVVILKIICTQACFFCTVWRLCYLQHHCSAHVRKSCCFGWYILQLGVNGYTFAVNHNGFVVFHPGLRLAQVQNWTLHCIYSSLFRIDTSSYCSKVVSLCIIRCEP